MPPKAMRTYFYPKALTGIYQNLLTLNTLKVSSGILSKTGILLLVISLSIFNSTFAQIKDGADALFASPSELKLLEGRRVGLIVNQTSVVGKQHLVDKLIERHINVVFLFTPEHGIRGTADAGEHLEGMKDAQTGIPVVSLYGRQRGPTPSQTDSVDVFIYDLEDVGCRFYTYISTLEFCLEAAAKAKKEFWVLDRLGYNKQFVAGPVLEPTYKSFVGMQCVPVLYGMTPGEYAQMLIGEHWLKNGGVTLKVVEGRYPKTMRKLFTANSVAPSPNLKTAQALRLYPSLCLFEGTPISVGRGTEKPFEQIGSPLPTTGFHTFTPQPTLGAKDPMHKGVVCYGLDLSKVKDQGFSLKYLALMYKLYPDKGRFFKPMMDRLAGTATIKEKLLAGIPYKEIEAEWEPAIAQFKTIRKKYLLYYTSER